MTWGEDLDTWISESAQYLIDLRKSFTDPIHTASAGNPMAQYSEDDSESALMRLDAMSRKLLSAMEEAAELKKREGQGRGYTTGFFVSKEVRIASDAMIEALQAGARAKRDILYTRFTNRRDHSERAYQLSACKLAIAYFADLSSRQARSVARKIMLDAGIPEPASASQFSILMKEARESLSGFAKTKP